MPWAFSRRSNGQTIDASHVNELQIGIETSSRRVYHVGEYGAVGDGTTNDTTAIQTAIDAAAAAGGGTVVIPAGTWSVNQLTLKTRVHLTGAGQKATTLKLRSGQDTPVLKTYVSPDGIISNAFWWQISHLGIDGNRAAQTTGTNAHGIEVVLNPLYAAATNDLDFDPDGRIHDVTIQFCRGSGYRHVGRSAVILTAVWADDNDKYGFDCSFDSTFVGCVASNSGDSGFRCSGATNNRFVGCKAYWNGRLDASVGNGAGWEIVAGSHINILSGCEAQDNKGPGFSLAQVRGCVLEGCLADSNSVVGIDTYTGYDLYQVEYSIVRGTATDRYPSGQQGLTGPSQLSAFRLRRGGGTNVARYNQVDLTHFGLNGASLGAACRSGSDAITETGNRIWLNGSQQTTNT